MLFMNPIVKQLLNQLFDKLKKNAKNGLVIEVWNKKGYQFKELSTRYTKASLIVIGMDQIILNACGVILKL